MLEMSATTDPGSALPSVRRTEGAAIGIWDRIGPVLGIVSVVVIMTGFFIHLYPNTSTPQNLVRWAASTDANRFVFGIYVEDLGYPLLLIFVAWLCHQLWRAGGSAWMLGLGLAALTVWAGVGFAIQGVWTALLQAGKSGSDALTLSAISQIASDAYTNINLALGLALVALGLGAVAAIGAPRWIGWTALAIGAAIVATYDLPNEKISGPIGLLVLVWSVAVSIRYLMRPAQVVAPTSTV
jgi:hypothetical protein